jgi:uncharacterized YigZ family protein
MIFIALIISACVEHFMTKDIYKTIEAPSEGIYKEKGSKFLAFAHPVYDENTIRDLVQEYRKKYFDARHHCYAWQMGADGALFRANDDGEPSGTAGKPIHGQIRSHELSNILIVVVRYFGGVKLGTGGLINAYKLAASDAIENAVIVEKTVNDFYRLLFDYGVMNDVMKLIKDENIPIVNQQFDLSCSIDFYLRQSVVDSIMARIAKIESTRTEFLYSR